MDYLTNILADFQDRLSDIAKVDGINYKLIKTFKSNLDTIHSEVKQTGKFGGLLQKIKRYQQTLDTVEKLPDLKADLETLREQSVVLIVGAFEVFIGDIFRSIANNRPDYYIWPEKDKKIAIGIESFTANFTLGDAIITHLDNKQYSFQDLGSVVDAVRDYLGVEIKVEEAARKVISLGTAFRHIIVHKASTVDRQFLSQTRGLSSVVYDEGDKIHINEDFVAQLRDAITTFSEELIQTLIQRDDVR